MKKCIFLIYREKTPNFSLNSIVSIAFHCENSLKIYSMDAEWKTASNDIGFIILTCGMVEHWLSIRHHPHGHPLTIPNSYQLSLSSCYIL
jgi:hypothetical protein